MKNSSTYPTLPPGLLKEEPLMQPIVCSGSPGTCPDFIGRELKGSIGIFRVSLRSVFVILFVTHSIFLFAQQESDSGKASIQLSFLDQDTIKQVTATVVKTNSEGKETPVKDVEVHFYVQRSYNPLPVGGDVQSTDESGSVTIDFPKDLPGDAAGNVTVIARVEDNDALGNLESTKVVKWGIPVVSKSLNQRALWASGANAPIPLVIAVTSMIILVWGVIIYIVGQLFRIKRLGKLE